MVALKKKRSSRFSLKLKLSRLKYYFAAYTSVLLFTLVTFIHHIKPNTNQYIPCSKQIPVGQEALHNPVKDYISSDTREFLGKVFEPWTGKSLCFPGHKNINKNGTDLKGLIYTRIHKASSSTLSGINIRIAKRQCKEMYASTWDHITGNKMDIAHRDKASTFLWTFIRSPTQRFISHYSYFVVSRRNIHDNDKNLCSAIRRPFGSSNYQLRFVHPNKLPSEIESTDTTGVIQNATDQVKRVFQEYDFIGVSERFDESLVAMQLLLGIDVGDILYISSNVHGGYDRVKDHLGYRCVKNRKCNVSPIMKKYFDTKRWYDINAGDFLLYETANRSLDMTIQRIGKEKFNVALFTFQYIKKKLAKCESVVKFPCDQGILISNVTNKCYMDDFGCGYPCVDEIYINITNKVPTKAKWV